MLPFGLLYLLVFAVLKATALDPPQAFRIPATLSNLPLTNLTSPDPIIELDGLPVLNQTTTGLSVIPDAFDLEISQGPLKINGKSTYMNILKALVTLSKQDFLANYAGNTFSFEGYTDMRVVITRTNSRSAALQYRFAIFGLYSGIYHISQKSKFRETFITLVRLFGLSISPSVPHRESRDIFEESLPRAILLRHIMCFRHIFKWQY